MRSTLRRVPAAAALTTVLTVALAVGLAGCASSGDDVRDLLADITVAANDRDADALREAADDLVDELRAQQQAGELDDARADRLTQLANQVRADADLIDQEVLDAETARQQAEEAERQADEEAARREDAEEAEKAADEAAEKAEQELREAEEKARELLEDKDDKGKDKDAKDGKDAKDDKDADRDAEQDDG